MIEADEPAPTGGRMTTQFRILALDGGGILGAFSAAVLAGLERRLSAPLAAHFDLIAGTSTGGIIAAALAAGEPAAKVVAFYSERGPRIFARPQGLRGLLAAGPDLVLRNFGLDAPTLLYPRYASGELAAALREVFGDRTLRDVRLSRLLLPAVELTAGRAVVFSTPHRPNPDPAPSLVEAVLATTAAPTYFQPVAVGGAGVYVDGGLWATNPALLAVVEAVRISESCRRPGTDRVFTPADVACLSIGTGAHRGIAEAPTGGGAEWWLTAGRMLRAVLASQADGTHQQVQSLLGGRYRRIDFEVPDAGWTIDNVALFDELTFMGEAAAEAVFASLQAPFFSAPAPPYTPFPSAGEVP